MTIKEIIKITATIIGREDVVNYLDGKTENVVDDTENAVDVMVRLSNLVINELACSFIPMKANEKLKRVGKTYYKDLEYNPLVILNAYDKDGNTVDFTVKNTFVDVNGLGQTLEYSYFPPDYTLEDKIGYTERDVSARVLAYGLAAEYAITQGCFKDAVMWHKRYADSIYTACLPKNSRIKERSWL